MLKTWTSKYPILKLACPQAINQIKLIGHMEEISKDSQQLRIKISYVQKQQIAILVHLTSNLIACINLKTSHVFDIFVEHSHSRDKETHIFNNIYMLIKITKVCYAFQINSIHASKIKRSFIKAYNGARGTWLGVGRNIWPMWS